MNLISIDIGNGYIKAVNQAAETLHFPTVIKPNTDKDIMGVSHNQYSIKIDGQAYFIGNLAIAKRGTRQWQSSKAVNGDTPYYLALCAHILTPEEETHPEIGICLGLPYSYYTSLDRGAALIKELTGKQIKTEYAGTKKEITISHVSVYPQGVGAYFSNLYDINGKPKKGAEDKIKALFIDIGFRTVDVVAFESLNNTFELIQENSFSLEEYGMFQAVNEVIKKTDAGIELTANDVEFALQNNHSKVDSMYGTTDLSSYEAEAYEQLAQQIATLINIRLSGQIQRYKNIYLTGGGAKKLYPYISKAYPNIEIQDDCIFCNAKGYLVLESTR
ncbi:ParM/StbA family protein [Clostridium minihomine]|uniref:ParM/StbA family protein n=1 Tax=Clostridium minihomine TaxID=2045012 RepID=UPI000C78883B|nr:ParM/StbA family protein [Clostridium minihomine]